jgi:hypothetical protein
MEVDQQSAAPRVAEPLQFLPQCAVIGLIDRINSAIEFLARQWFAPQFAEARNPPRYQAKTVPRPPIEQRIARRTQPASRDHLPVDVFHRAIEIDHRPRRIGDQQAGPGRSCQHPGEAVNEAIFEADTRLLGRAQGGQNIVRIGSTCVGHGNQHRNRRLGRCPKPIGRCIKPGNQAAFLLWRGEIDYVRRIVRHPNRRMASYRGISTQNRDCGHDGRLALGQRW